jgi:ketosteroid isomerase-like protein
MSLTEAIAREVLDSAHAAWSNADIEGVLSCYVDDLTFWCNSGGPDGGALLITGKANLRAFLQSIVDVAESVSVSEYFRLADGIGRAKIECYIRHRKTGHTMAGSYRQLVSYRDSRILQISEYHDAARMAAFWRLIAGEPLALENPCQLDDDLALIASREKIAR